MKEASDGQPEVGEEREAPEYDTIAWQIERFAEEVEQAMRETPFGAEDDEGRPIAPQLYRMANFLRHVREDIANRQYDRDFGQPKFLLAAMQVFYRYLTAQSTGEQHDEGVHPPDSD